MEDDEKAKIVFPALSDWGAIRDFVTLGPGEEFVVKIEGDKADDIQTMADADLADFVRLAACVVATGCTVECAAPALREAARRLEATGKAIRAVLDSLEATPVGRTPRETMIMVLLQHPGG